MPRSLNRASTAHIGKSTVPKTSRQKDDKTLVKTFAQQTDSMHTVFKSSKKADTRRNDRSVRFACPVFLREATARCKVSDRPNRTEGLCRSPLVSMMGTADLRPFH
jgi:hypothetical protein